LLTGLKKRLDGHPLVRDVRGRGLLVAIELGATQEAGFFNRLASSFTDVVSKKVFGQWLALRLLEEGILAQPASQQWNVLKLEPPLTVTAAQIDRVIHSVASILERYRDLGPLMKDVAERMGKQFFAGNPFG
jgi:putrescine aminotransferase